LPSVEELGSYFLFAAFIDYARSARNVSFNPEIIVAIFLSGHPGMRF